MSKIHTYSEDINDFFGGCQVAFKNVQQWKIQQYSKEQDCWEQNAYTALTNAYYNHLFNYKLTPVIMEAEQKAKPDRHNNRNQQTYAKGKIKWQLM